VNSFCQNDFNGRFSKLSRSKLRLPFYIVEIIHSCSRITSVESDKD
jgi:hypothetical protein